MLQQEKPDDFVLATGVQFSVRHLCELCFGMAGMKIRWEGTGLDEKGIVEGTDKVVIKISETYYRPTEVETLLGDPAKAKKILGITMLSNILVSTLYYEKKKKK